MRKREALRRLAHTERTLQHTYDWVDELAEKVRQHACDLAIAEDALEAERQWRLTSLPALLAAEERAVKAEAEVASFRNVTEYREVPIVSGGGPNLPRQFPELRPPRIPSAAAVRAASHQSTNEERP